jgi:hypothetical protein
MLDRQSRDVQRMIEALFSPPFPTPYFRYLQQRVGKEKRNKLQHNENKGEKVMKNGK